MKSKRKNPLHDPYTCFTGVLQEFSGPALPPDDPRVQGNVRKGRPGDAKPGAKKKPSRKKKD